MQNYSCPGFLLVATDCCEYDMLCSIMFSFCVARLCSVQLTSVHMPQNMQTFIMQFQFMVIVCCCCCCCCSNNGLPFFNIHNNFNCNRCGNNKPTNHSLLVHMFADTNSTLNILR